MEKKLQNAGVDLTDLAIGIVVLGVAVTVGVTILVNMRDTRLTELPILTTANETVAATGDTFANTWFQSVTSCVNATNGVTVGTGNYSTSVDAFGTGSIANLTTDFSGYNLNCTYTTYDITSPEYALANDAAVGLAEYGNWFKILVIVGIAAVVLALIFMAFGGRQGGMNY